MFKDKLVIFTYKNTIYQSKLKLLAIFLTILVCLIYKTLKRKKEMKQKIKSMLQSSDKGSYYNYLK
jgi:lysophospholipid acyltransferase (LPLAT)-like uncharacterized protein